MYAESSYRPSLHSSRRRTTLGLGAAETFRQTDTFYRAICGRLKLRDFGDGSAELIAYSRPDQTGPKISTYTTYSSATPISLHEVLAQSLGVRGVVRKTRQVIHIGQTRVHLDEVIELGEFMELDVMLQPDQSEKDGEEIATELLETLGIESSALWEGAYIDLLEEQAASTGTRKKPRAR